MIAPFITLSLAASPVPAVDCTFDTTKMVALDQASFDQDMNGGWRALAAKGCDAAAADAIEAWRNARETPQSVIYWHEGQMRANAGQYKRAITLFKLSKHKVKIDNWGWNLYVDGSIAFLEHDRSKLIRVRNKLEQLPEPADFKRMIRLDGSPSQAKWPLNLDVLDAFIRCWGKSYKEAYACPKEIKG